MSWFMVYSALPAPSLPCYIFTRMVRPLGLPCYGNEPPALPPETNIAA